ncbi:carbohydrate ABC transporter permease [Niveibacterium sp.]|uniref:carbohydrate ABC transporter permease n=1 Tax=Niveibacterium sp. TaxID=2017444 RepID=UPI0035AF6AAF
MSGELVVKRPGSAGAVRALAAQGRAWRARLANPSEQALAWLLLAPAALLLLLIVAYPVGRLVWSSLHDLRLSALDVAVPPFVGLRNFADLGSDPAFLDALWNTAKMVLVTVPGALVAGLILALLANIESGWRWLVRLALLLPWALPLSFTGLIGAWFFDYQHGLINDLLQRFGGTPRLWLTDAWLAQVAVWVVMIWKSSSFIGLILLAGLQMIPQELHDAAALDGANRLQRFRHITLPLLAPSIMVALIFRTITALQTFDVPYSMTHGGPGSATLTLAMYIHTTTVEYLDVGYGAALALSLAGLSMLTTFVYLRFVLRESA